MSLWSAIKKFFQNMRSHLHVGATGAQSIAAYQSHASNLDMIQGQHAKTPFTKILLWRCNDVRFTEFAEGLDFTEWGNGVVFGDDAQIRWRKRGRYFHVVLLGDKDIYGEWEHSVPISKNEAEPKSVFLWGEKQFADGRGLPQWYEPRIPHVIADEMGYPLTKGDLDDSKKRVALKVQTYGLEETNNPITQGRSELDLPPLAVPENQVTYLERFTGLEEK